MTWTYTASPLTVPRDAARLEIGDTVAADPLLQDSEIDYYLTQEPTLQLACAKCCEAIAALYSRLADSTIDKVSQSMSQKSAQYRKRAIELRRQVPMTPTFGGISHAAKDAVSQDADAVQPVFEKGADDIPGAPTDMTTIKAIDQLY